MKVVLLAGGFGTRISEESQMRPKPMVEIDGMPILWHIMKYYSTFGYNEFVVCCGYKGYVIKEFFANYYLHRSDITFDFVNENEMTVHSNIAEPWKVTLVDTGLNTMTGGRLKRVQKYIGNEPFMLTYGDGVCDVDIDKLLKLHKESGRIATVTAVQPEGRFGIITTDIADAVTSFSEKSKEDIGWINGGYFVFEPQIFDLLQDDSTVLEKYPLETLAKEKQLQAYRHNGFWQCMDTLRDKQLLEKLIENKEAPWIKW